jgi:hypothetical protein
MSLNRFATGGVFACILMVGGNAGGMYLGVSTQLHTTVTVGGTSRNIYRVYALFDNSTDFVTAVAGSDGVGNMVIRSRNSSDTAAGSNFYNPSSSVETAPPAPDGSVEYGTFATIGISLASQGSGPGGTDQTGVTPGFPSFINGNQLNSNNMAWFTPGPTEQGRAGYMGDGDAELRVLLMQLTVNAGDHVRSTFAVAGYHTVALAAVVPFNAMNQTTTSVPAPGMLGLVVAVGMMRTRRREG